MKRDPDPAVILKEALELPREARAAIAGALINSLDEEIDEGVEAAWAAEIDRRLAEIESGTAQLVPWDEVKRRLKGKHPAR